MNRYERLRAVDPNLWAATGRSWRSLVKLLRQRAGELATETGRLSADWTGPARRAAGDRLAALGTELVGLTPLGIEVDQILAEFAARLRAAKARLAATVALPPDAGVLIDPHGRVSVSPAPALLPAAERTAVRVAAGIDTALGLADVADREAADRFTELAGALADGWADPPGGYRPPIGVDPALVRLWWQRLTPAQRRWLVGHEPALVGRLDGVPAAARDQANRLLLAARRNALLAERAELLCRTPPGPVQAVALARIDARIRGFDTLADRLAAEGGQRGYLLGLDPAGDGRAVIALGNPDRSANVLTYVPGMTSDLASLGGELRRADRMAARCAELAPEEETATVLWLDYDAPDRLDDAARTGPARDAGPTLHRFQEGLRLTHDGPPARQTVLGHSYGSLVVGTAARKHGLAADALIFVGSPGVGVDHAAALGLPVEQIWAATAPDDPIRHVRPPEELAGRAAIGGLTRALLGRSDDELWFGRNPTDPGFGGRVLPSAAGGHSGYWDPDNPALDGMARVVLGRV